jgi:hypothetical protein
MSEAIRIPVLPEDRVRIDPEVWAQVAGHIERREAMPADYQTLAGRVSRYGLHPGNREQWNRE